MIDSVIKTKWDSGSRNVWVVICENCDKHNKLIFKNNVQNITWPKGFCCKCCGAVLNIKNGKWTDITQNDQQ